MSFALLYLCAIALLAVAALGGFVYQLLALYCVALFRRRQALTLGATAPSLPPISLLKPLHGAEAQLENYLTSFFTQNYPRYEILFAVRASDDPAVAVVNRLRARYPHIAAQLLLTGEPPCANAKVFSMELMAAAARYDVLAITDSDTAVAADYLQALARAFADPHVGAVTQLYRGAANNDLWARLEALGMSTEFMAGVLVAEKLEGMKFALGPSMAVRRACLQDIGGFTALRDYLADDFVLGHWADRAGWRVALDPFVVTHHVSTTGCWPTFEHRLRWNRSTRFSRPAGYAGQGFTYALSWAALLALSFPHPLTLALLALTACARCAAAIWLGARVLSDTQVIPRLWLLPLQDALSFASWLGGWMSREINWRGERYRLLAGGKFAPVVPRNS